jgi:hypothetical protein
MIRLSQDVRQDFVGPTVLEGSGRQHAVSQVRRQFFGNLADIVHHSVGMFAPQGLQQRSDIAFHAPGQERNLRMRILVLQGIARRLIAKRDDVLQVFDSIWMIQSTIDNLLHVPHRGVFAVSGSPPGGTDFVVCQTVGCCGKGLVAREIKADVSRGKSTDGGFVGLLSFMDCSLETVGCRAGFFFVKARGKSLKQRLGSFGPPPHKSEEALWRQSHGLKISGLSHLVSCCDCGGIHW